jgi:hypothetical protein
VEGIRSIGQKVIVQPVDLEDLKELEGIVGKIRK